MHVKRSIRKIYKSRNFVKNGNVTTTNSLKKIYKSRNFVKNGNANPARLARFDLQE